MGCRTSLPVDNTAVTSTNQRRAVADDNSRAMLLSTANRNLAALGGEPVLRSCCGCWCLRDDDQDVCCVHRETMYGGTDGRQSCVVCASRQELAPSTPAVDGEDSATTTENIVPPITVDTITERLAQVGDTDLKCCIQTCLAAAECPICLDAFSPDACTLACGHSLCHSHTEDLSKCPVCRQPIYPMQKRALQPSLTLRETVSALTGAMDMMLRMEEQSRQRVLELDNEREENSQPEPAAPEPVGSEPVGSLIDLLDLVDDPGTLPSCGSPHEQWHYPSNSQEQSPVEDDIDMELTDLLPDLLLSIGRDLPVDETENNTRKPTDHDRDEQSNGFLFPSGIRECTSSTPHAIMLEKAVATTRG